MTHGIPVKKYFCLNYSLWGILYIIILFASFPVFSQSTRLISTKDGLPQSFVSGLEQDDASFIWIATRNGLARYDGIQYKLFQHDARDSSTLASNLIIWLRKDNQNHLWIEFENGSVDMMDPVTERIRHYINADQIPGGRIVFIRRGWLVDHDDNFWGIVKAAGVSSYDVHNKKLKQFGRQNAGLASDTVRGIVETKDGLWMLDDRQINLYDFKTQTFTHWSLPFVQDYGSFTGSDAIAIDVHERKNGELMWGDRQRLYFFQPTTHLFRSIVLPSTAYLGIRWIRTAGDGYDYFENYGQVYRYNDQSGLSSIGKTLNTPLGDVKSFLVDRSGLIWLGTNAQGIHLIDLETPFFQSFTYNKDFASDMMQQEMGVDLRKLVGWTAADQQFSQPSYYIRSVYDANRRFYLALKETVCYWNAGQNHLIILPPVPILADTEKLRIGIRGITILPNNEPLVIGYNGDMMYFNSTGNKWISFVEPGLLRKKFGPLMLPLNMLADGQNIWITTEEDGLIQMNIQTKKITQLKENMGAHSLPANQLLSMTSEPAHPDLLWIGSYQGLIKLDKNTLTSEVFSLKEGLPDNTIYSILSDSLGYLWLSTNKGICRFEPQTQKIRAFHTIDGLPGDEFNRFHHLQLPDGTLTFGGTDGWTRFNPLRMKNDNYEPAVALTDIKINSKDFTQLKNKDSVPLPVNAIDHLTLPFEQNTLNFGFAGLEFSQPQNLQYRYRLEGYDNDWVLAGNTHQASYTKIPPGTYTFLVNASNGSGKWSKYIKSFKLQIDPPWWATKMAYICYTIILAGLVWTFIRFRVSREIMKQEIVLKEKQTEQLKELDDMKSRFFSNITHEFRTPLTLIMGPAEQLQESGKLEQPQYRMATTIMNNSRQLLILINRLMDLSKLEAKAMQLQEQRGNPGDAIGSIVYSFEHDAANKQIEMNYQDLTGSIDCWFFADALERIVYNLVSNALKFTLPGGIVETILTLQDEKIELVVKDTGIGIPKDKLPFIFERFYQASENSVLANEETNPGTGIGLSLVKELVNQTGGTIKVESKTSDAGSAESGTVFTVYMPFRLVSEEKIAPADEIADNSNENIRTDSSSIPEILLVEDNLELAGFIKGILSSTYTVTHVLNGAIGLATAFSNMPDLIVSDVMMPVMDGYEMCGRLKEDIRSSHIPLILLTAKVSQENKMEGLSKGADDYLIKPFHPSELQLRIHNLLERQTKLRNRIREELAELQNADFKKEKAPLDIFLVRLYALLDEHLDDNLFGVDQLVDLIHLSRSSLHRKLKTLTGMSTSELVRNYRLQKAASLLREGYNSSDAAYKTGFGSPAYFTRSFREVYGMTPGDYIKKQKG
jgi:signal transduction histidine kinase/ligand-binding sensor domain-containing protein/AraC-like DNA-binding protein